jgi:hypothetical protein
MTLKGWFAYMLIASVSGVIGAFLSHSLIAMFFSSVALTMLLVEINDYRVGR